MRNLLIKVYTFLVRNKGYYAFRPLLFRFKRINAIFSVPLFQMYKTFSM